MSGHDCVVFVEIPTDLEPSKRTETRGSGNRAEAEAIVAAARERAA